MAQSLSKVYLHVIFSTKNREAFIDSVIEEELFKYLAGILRNMECTAIKVGGVSDHIHILNILSRKISISDMIGVLKKDSSKWIKTKGIKYKNFHWQNGYGVFSVGEKNLDLVEKYIEDQYTHHRRRSFQEEYIIFLKTYNVKYDEKYVWD